MIQLPPKSEIKEMALSDIHKADYNPRIMPEDEYQKLVHNIKEEGYLELIVVNKRTNYTIVSGNHRYDVLLELGWIKAHVIIIDVTLEREKALNVAMNRISGVFDQEKLENLIKNLEDSGFSDMELTGLSDFEFDMIEANFDDDPYADEFDNEEIIFKTENEEKRGSSRPKKEKKENKIKTIICPHCGEELEV